MKKNNKAAKTRKPATRRKRPVNDLTARTAPSGGADGSVRPSGIQVVMADGSVRF